MTNTSFKERWHECTDLKEMRNSMRERKKDLSMVRYSTKGKKEKNLEKTPSSV